MPLLQGVVVNAERDPASVTSYPRAIYIAAHPTISGRYILSDSPGEAAAYLKEDSVVPNLYSLDDDSAEADRILYQTSTTRVLL